MSTNALVFASLLTHTADELISNDNKEQSFAVLQCMCDILIFIDDDDDDPTEIKPTLFVELKRLSIPLSVPFSNHSLHLTNNLFVQQLILSTSIVTTASMVHPIRYAYSATMSLIMHLSPECPLPTSVILSCLCSGPSRPEKRDQHLSLPGARRADGPGQ